MLQRYYTSWELHNMIVAIVRNSGSKGITRAQICQQLGRSKAPHILDVIEDCVEKDLITKVDLKRGNQGYFLYFTPGNLLQARLETEGQLDKS